MVVIGGDNIGVSSDRGGNVRERVGEVDEIGNVSDCALDAVGIACSPTVPLGTLTVVIDANVLNDGTVKELELDGHVIDENSFRGKQGTVDAEREVEVLRGEVDGINERGIVGVAVSTISMGKYVSGSQSLA